MISKDEANFYICESFDNEKKTNKNHVTVPDYDLRGKELIIILIIKSRRRRWRRGKIIFMISIVIFANSILSSCWVENKMLRTLLLKFNSILFVIIIRLCDGGKRNVEMKWYLMWNSKRKVKNKSDSSMSVFVGKKGKI